MGFTFGGSITMCFKALLLMSVSTRRYSQFSHKDMTLILFYKSAELGLSPPEYNLKLSAFLKGSERVRFANISRFKFHRTSCISV
jgi:hypothetical protein